jgi:mono/diheme cytochrome c family protein
MANRKRVFVGTLVAIITALVGLGVSIYLSNARMLDRRYPLVVVSVPVAKGTAAVARGKRLADITGCTDCHGADLRGKLFIDDGWLSGRYYASNLTLKAQSYSDVELSRVVRNGVRPDGRGVVAMPAFAFVRLTDMEMADIIAFLRSLPVGGSEQPEHHIGPLDQWNLWRGLGPKTAISYVADERAKQPADAGSRHAAARHLVGIVCAECHGGDLKGDGWSSGAPDLRVVAAYGLPELARLLRSGIGVDGKEHGLMTLVARDRLHKLSDQEIADIHAYLVARMNLPP